MRQRQKGAPCADKACDCQRLKVPGGAACRPCINPITDIPITDLHGPDWMGWLEVCELFTKERVPFPDHLPGVRRYYAGDSAAVNGHYFKPDVLACLRETAAREVENRMGAQDR